VTVERTRLSIVPGLPFQYASTIEVDVGLHQTLPPSG